MTEMENIIANYMEHHKSKSVLVWNFCMINFDRLTKIFETDLFYNNDLFEQLKTTAENDRFNNISCGYGKYIRVDKS